MSGRKKLVIGASGFLGSHVTRALVERGDDVRVLLRTTSSTKAIDDLDVEIQHGDIVDDAALRAAMAGCDDVWRPSPVHDSIRRAAAFYRNRGRNR